MSTLRQGHITACEYDDAFYKLLSEGDMSPRSSSLPNRTPYFNVAAILMRILLQPEGKTRVPIADKTLLLALAFVVSAPTPEYKMALLLAPFRILGRFNDRRRRRPPATHARPYAMNLSRHSGRDPSLNSSYL